jgi:uncharacterized protein YacL
MITTNKGNNAPINDPNPLEIYLMLQVLNPFAKINRKKAMSSSDFSCEIFGHGSPFNLKKMMNTKPAINCRIAEICNPGTFSTAILLATQVLPQIKLVAHNAR